MHTLVVKTMVLCYWNVIYLECQNVIDALLVSRQRRSDMFTCAIYSTVVSIHLYICLQWANIIDSGVIVLVITTFVKS